MFLNRYISNLMERTNNFYNTYMRIIYFVLFDNVLVDYETCINSVTLWEGFMKVLQNNFQ